jgi:hypothetical protein
MTTYAHNVENELAPITSEPTYSDLRDEIGRATSFGNPVEVYEVRITGGDGYARSGNVMEVVFFPQDCRGGVAWGGYAEWTDARSAHEVVERYLTDDLIP